MKPVRLGVLSTADIARLVIAANQGSGHTRFVAVASRDEAKAQRFAADLSLEASFGSYPARLVADGAISKLSTIRAALSVSVPPGDIRRSPTHTERLPADPDGTYRLTGEEADAYRIEFDVVSAAIAEGAPAEFGRAGAVDQAAVLEALGRSAATGLPVAPLRSAAEV